MTTPPLMSVVVPTSGRPQLLPETVRSALATLENSVEVIVVPNGPDTSWRESMTPFKADERVRIETINATHANAARNHGLALARGTYIRFLDDDDLITSDAAARQCTLMESTGADLCSGAIRRIEDDGSVHSIMRQRDTTDLVSALARPGRVCLPHAHLFRRDALANLKWDESIPCEQDTDWMLRACVQREWNWARTDEVVGVWRHHAGARTSTTIDSHMRGRIVSRMFMRTADDLRVQERLTTDRADAFAEGLWAYVHAHFFRSPAFWIPVARAALALSPGRRPDDNFFDSVVGRNLDPVLVELALTPKRWLNAGGRALKHALHQR